MGNWRTDLGWDREDLGGGDRVLSDLGDGGQSTNTTPLSAAIQIDVDLKLTSLTASNSLCVYFHLHATNSPTYQKAYQLHYVDGWGTDNDGLSLRKKVADYGAVENLAYASVPLDTNVHHVRIADDGVGGIKVYWDDMGLPIFQVNDPNYIGADNQYVGVGSGSPVFGWIDNVKVYGDAAPLAVTDLAAGNPDWFKLDLTWTAPWDLPPAPVDSYDIRYSTSPIDEGNWAAATQVSGEPLSTSPGYPESLTVTGLNVDTKYYFALKSADAGGLVSSLSNVASGTTGPPDTTAPATVDDLSLGETGPNRVTLSWTAVGDDGTTGTASTCDVRYSTSPIDEANWAAASQAVGEPAPRSSGTDETFTVTGLQGDTLYYFAVKVGDEVRNWSTLSNVVSTTTLPPDSSPPAAVTDLQVVNRHIRTVTLRWTAPADVGDAGVGSYDLRYSTVAITEGNWASAVQVTGEPVPAVPGVTETFMVTGLDPQTTYYFALKSVDLAEPPNVSDLSNVVSGETLPPVPAVTIQNPWIVNDRVADCRTETTMGNTFINSYQPGGVTFPSTNEEKAINCYDNIKRRFYHWGAFPPDYRNTLKNINVFGWALCGSHATFNTKLLEYVTGINGRRVSIASGAHTCYEAEYDGAWHFFDTMCTFYVFTRGASPHVASGAECAADHTLITDAVAEARACPGFLLCGDDPVWYANGMDSLSVLGGPDASNHSMDTDLRIGEAVTRTWETWDDQCCPGGPHYHHESQYDWKDTVNYPYWEPYALYGWEGKSVTYRRWANGTIELQPDFRSAGYEASLEPESTSIATYNQDALTPDMHVAAVGTLAEAVFKISTPLLRDRRNHRRRFLSARFGRFHEDPGVDQRGELVAGMGEHGHRRDEHSVELPYASVRLVGLLGESADAGRRRHHRRRCEQPQDFSHLRTQQRCDGVPGSGHQ